MMHGYYWGKCGENEPGRLMGIFNDLGAPRNIHFVATSSIIDFDSIIYSLKGLDPSTEITFSDSYSLPQQIIQNHSNQDIKFTQLDVSSILDSEPKYSMIVAFGLFSKQVFWDGTTQALNNLSEILKPDGILLVSVKFDYYEEFKDFIEESELSIDQWHSEYEHISMQRRMKIEKRFGVKGRGDIRVTYYLKKTE